VYCLPRFIFCAVLGQRLPYVLLAGKGKQDESSASLL